MTIPLLPDIVIILGLSSAVLFLCHRLHIPTIVGFLLTGLLAGPHGFRVVKAVHDVEVLAEIGVVLLLFTIGLEFSLHSLFQIKRAAVIGGALQVILTSLAGFAIASKLGQPVGVAVLLGFLISLSSTAIVLGLLQERAEIDSAHGRVSLAILIFQDIMTVPMMLVTPLLAGTAASIGESLLILAIKGIGIIGLVIVSARWVVPWLLYQVARTRSREFFLLSIVVICLSVAWLTSSLGLSLALGAFLAGLIISESEYSDQALGNIIPFRDVFTSFFFVSIGMLLNIGFLLRQPGVIVLTAAGVLIIKSLIAGLAVLLLGLPLRTAVLVGMALCQIGEFSFILSKAGVESGVLNDAIYQRFLAVSVVTMAAAPFILTLAPRVAGLIIRFPLPGRIKSGWYEMPAVTGTYPKDYLQDHLVIIGFGVNGRNVARAARIAMIPYVIIEMNPETVRTERANGEPISYGDATQEAVLGAVGIAEARVAVVAVADPVTTRSITATVRRLSPKAYLIARTRYLREMKPLYDLGANEVIPEEFETSIEIFTRVLERYLIPRNDIEAFITEVRSDGYEMLRSLSKGSTSLADLKLHLPDIEICTFRVSGRSPLVGKTLAQAELRTRYGVTVLLIQRDAQTIPNPDGTMLLCADDVAVILGRPEEIAEVVEVFYGAGEEDTSSSPVGSG
ncbi:MAG: cation:proton antiporter [Candidatus Latescibacteria bacterium]|nr:cation:proton antiporter [Candidatus Latescibacterota bacterium]